MVSIRYGIHRTNFFFFLSFQVLRKYNRFNCQLNFFLFYAICKSIYQSIDKLFHFIIYSRSVHNFSCSPINFQASLSFQSINFSKKHFPLHQFYYINLLSRQSIHYINSLKEYFAYYIRCINMWGSMNLKLAASRH